MTCPPGFRAAATFIGCSAAIQASCVRLAPNESPALGDEVPDVNTPAADEAWIDDFEDGNDRLLPYQGRNGVWFMTDDGSDGGVRNPDTYVELIALLRPDGSRWAMHIWGHGFVTWGASLNAWFFESDKLRSFDASRYKGIRFFARIESTTDQHLRVNIPSRGTEDEDGCTVCHDRYGVDLLLTTSWAEHFIDFSACAQGGWGDPVAFDRSNLYGLEFATRETAQFDIWIDDVRFY